MFCDDTADGYLRVTLDGILDNWVSTIHRKRTSSHNNKIFGRITDIILVYGFSHLNKVTTELDPNYIERFYKFKDEKGRWASRTLTNRGNVSGESGQPWKGYNPSNTGRHWRPPKDKTYAIYINDNFIPGYLSIKSIHNRLEALNNAGLIHWSGNGVPRLKQYLMPNQKQIVSNFWADCKDKQVTGYPTEKSLVALERIVLAGSNPGHELHLPTL